MAGLSIGAPPSSAPTSSARLAQVLATAGAPAAAKGTLSEEVRNKARASAVDFEATFLNTMFSQMFTSVGNDGPFGGGRGIGVWRSFLTDEYAKSFAKNGGIGLADHVTRSLLAQQEARAR